MTTTISTDMRDDARVTSDPGTLSRVDTETDLDTHVDTVACPDCGQPAVVEWRTTIASTGGPVEHVKIACPAGHRYFMPAERLG
jgi:hypothetical protein